MTVVLACFGLFLIFFGLSFDGIFRYSYLDGICFDQGHRVEGRVDIVTQFGDLWSNLTIGQSAILRTIGEEFLFEGNTLTRYTTSSMHFETVAVFAFQAST